MISKYMFLIGLLALTMSCSSSTTDAAVSSPEPTSEEGSPANLQAEERKDVSYGNNGQQAYDIYLPANRTAQDTKVLLLIHGGSWTAGDKSDMNFFLPILQPQLEDYAIVNMNYVLATDTTPAFPNQINDVGAVIKHVIENAADYNINPSFGIIGLSAGAHIGLQYAYTQNDDNAIKMAASVVGPVDFTDPYYSENPNFQFVEDLVDSTAYPENADLESILSPALQVTNTTAPTILFYGESDFLVPQSQANAINDALEENNITHSLTVYEGGHANWSFASYIDLQMKLVAFVKAHL